jgi:endonuclease/exonuclease/phosphatase (EEP) superfamily protein YafD
VLDAIDREELPVVAAGDFNLTDRGRGYRRVADRLTDAMRSSWGAPTSRKLGFLPLLLRIDHVFIPDGWCSDHAHHFQLAGSDHRGVVVRVGPCR